MRNLIQIAFGGHTDNESTSSDDSTDEEQVRGLSRLSRKEINSMLSKLRKGSSKQRLALQKFSEALSVSDRNGSMKSFPVHAFAKELVRITAGLKDGKPDLMMLACRCISDLIELIPASVSEIVSCDVIPVLCQKLKAIQYIDLAEQALYALDKIALQQPRAVLQDGGLCAALMHFDFFGAYAQRVAMTIASNCLRFMRKESFPKFMEVKSTLLKITKHSNKKVSDLSFACWVSVATCWSNDCERMELAIPVELLSILIGLMSRPNDPTAIHVYVLPVVRAIAGTSPLLSLELIKLGTIEKLYNVVAGINEFSECARLILKVMLDLLPDFPKIEMYGCFKYPLTKYQGMDPRAEWFMDHPDFLSQLASLLIPRLLDLHSLNFDIYVRGVCFHILVLLLHYSDVDMLLHVLKDVSLVNLLSGTFALKEHPMLIKGALYGTEIMINKLPHVYLPLIEREGILHGLKVLSRLSFSTSLEYTEDMYGRKVAVATHGKSLAQMDNDCDLGNAQQRRGMIQCARDLIQTHFPSSNGMHFDNVVGLVQDLGSSEGLEKLGTHLRQSGISRFELMDSGLMEALLAQPGFERQLDMDALKALTMQVKNVLNLRERFQMAMSDAVMGNLDNLTGKLRLKMIGVKEKSVSIHAVATFKVLGDYMMGYFKEVETNGIWELQFSINGIVVPYDSTVYGAIYPTAKSNVWRVEHPVEYEFVKRHEDIQVSQLPRLNVTLDLHPQCEQAIALLKILGPLLPDCVDQRLSAKVMRQMKDSLIVVSSSLPHWFYWLMQQLPFLFSVEARYLFIQCTSFSYSHMFSRLDPVLGRLDRHKVRVPRHRMLKSAVRIMGCYGKSEIVLEVEFFEEEGTGIGPTCEFYAAASKEFSQKSLLWYKDVLFPKALVRKPYKVLKLFKALGQFVARSMLESKVIDIPFNVAFFKVALYGEHPSLALMKDIDPQLAKSMQVVEMFAKQKQSICNDGTKSSEEKEQAIKLKNAELEDLCLDFTFPGNEGLELKAGGSYISVTMDNVEEYLDLVMDKMMGSGIADQIQVFRMGFNEVFCLDDLKILTPSELVDFFGAVEEDWSISTLSSSIRADHGFTMESNAVQNLLQTLSEFTTEERRKFLQFSTGAPRLPVGGWKSLKPNFTVVHKIPEAPLTDDDYLPSVMTCANYFKMPNYSTKQIMNQKIKTSMNEGLDIFLLT